MTNHELQSLIQSLNHLNQEKDTSNYRSEWGLGDESWEFASSIEERENSLIWEYALNHDIAFDDMAEIINQAR